MSPCVPRGILIDANLPRQVAELFRHAGWHAEDAAACFPPGTRDVILADHAKAHQLIILTRDTDFADVRLYPPEEFCGLVVLSLPQHAAREQILEACRCLLADVELLKNVPGRLAIVEMGRVGIRPAF